MSARVIFCSRGVGAILPRIARTLNQPFQGMPRGWWARRVSSGNVVRWAFLLLLDCDPVWFSRMKLWRAYRCPDHRGNGQCRQNCCHDRRFASHGRDRQFLSPNCRISTRRAKQYSRYKTLKKSNMTESPLF
jgi:hypothetical protein